MPDTVALSADPGFLHRDLGEENQLHLAGREALVDSTNNFVARRNLSVVDPGGNPGRGETRGDLLYPRLVDRAAVAEDADERCHRRPLKTVA